VSDLLLGTVERGRRGDERSPGGPAAQLVPERGPVAVEVAQPPLA
jgi:hypothetical protein